MAWVNSVGRDISHYNSISNYTAAKASTDWWQIKVSESTDYADPMASQHYAGLSGDPRGAYHFARPVSLTSQIAWFLNRKNSVSASGSRVWERPDMLDCEFPGVTSAFIRSLVAEYRRQSGIQRVLVYVGYSDLRGSCNPSGWYDENTPIWAARYRKIGAPSGPDSWGQHLGWDHPGLAIYQWDNATALPGGGPTDINSQRVALGGDMPLTESDVPIIAKGVEKYLLDTTSVGPDNALRSLVDGFRQNLVWTGQALNQATAANAALAAVLQAVTNDADVTAAQVKQIVEAAVANQPPIHVTVDFENLSDEELARFAKAINDESDRRWREGHGVTPPV